AAADAFIAVCERPAKDTTSTAVALRLPRGERQLVASVLPEPNLCAAVRRFRSADCRHSLILHRLAGRIARLCPATACAPLPGLWLDAIGESSPHFSNKHSLSCVPSCTPSSLFIFSFPFSLFVLFFRRICPQAKPQDDFAALGNQLRSTVALLKAPSTLLSTEGFSKTRTVVDSVTLDIKYFGPSPAPTPAPTAAPSIDPSKPGAGGLNPKDKPQKATSESKGGMSTAGKYAALAAAGLAGITVVYCCLGSALRNRKSVAADKEKEQARRKEDDEIFRRAQAANAAKLALANESTAVPLS
ncbi:unnamed protein product, partial [Phaeothamnion confervicola]